MTSSTPENITADLPAEEPQPIEIADGNITLIFPNYSTEPIRQTWRVRSLISIPYFRALLEGKWMDSKERTLTLEDDPVLFTKMIKRVNFGSLDKQYNSMLDFYNIEPKKLVQKRLQIYKKFTFTAEKLRQPLDLGNASEANEIVDLKITSSIPLAHLKRRLLFYLDGVETGRADEPNYVGGGVGQFLSLVMNAMIASDGKIGPIEMRLQIRPEEREEINLPAYLYVCVIYKK